MHHARLMDQTEKSTKSLGLGNQGRKERRYIRGKAQQPWQTTLPASGAERLVVVVLARSSMIQTLTITSRRGPYGTEAYIARAESK